MFTGGQKALLSFLRLLNASCINQPMMNEWHLATREITPHSSLPLPPTSLWICSVFWWRKQCALQLESTKQSVRAVLSVWNVESTTSACSALISSQVLLICTLQCTNPAEKEQRKYADGHDFTQTHEDTHMAGRRSHTRADNTRPHRSRASLTSSFALESVVARTLL